MQTPLRKIRLEKKLTISEVANAINCEVANAINCDVGNLSRLERGTQAASLELAERLARFYGDKITEMQILYPKRYM
ncbi:TPA: helix-turn-helix transcriptional regulator [Providencia alcalifaciens]|nr:helix-turn-helix transcriptional regulator [Providencia alcalifaciens]